MILLKRFAQLYSKERYAVLNEKKRGVYETSQRRIKRKDQKMPDDAPFGVFGVASST